MKLTEIQQQLKAPKNQHNKFGNYNYRSCEDILEAVKPLLGDSSLVLTDEIKSIGAYTFVEATAHFTDSDSKSNIVKAQAGISDRKGMDIAQSFGSSSSYARKYALNGLFLIDDTKDADTQDKPKDDDKLSIGIAEINMSVSVEQVKDVWNKYTHLQKDKRFIDAASQMKVKLENK